MHRQVHQPLIVDSALEQLNNQCSVLVMDDLLGDRLANTSARSAENLLPSMKYTIVVPDEHVARAQLQTQLMRRTTHDLEELLLGVTSFQVLIVGPKDVRDEIRVPANALENVRTGDH